MILLKKKYKPNSRIFLTFFSLNISFFVFFYPICWLQFVSLRRIPFQQFCLIITRSRCSITQILIFVQITFLLFSSLIIINFLINFIFFSKKKVYFLLSFLNFSFFCISAIYALTSFSGLITL